MKQKGNVIIILVLTVAIVLGVALYSQFQSVPKSSEPTPTPQTAQAVSTSSPEPENTKTFQSKNLHFSIQVSPNFQIKDDDTSVDLVSSDGQISIVRNGTNFNDLNSYISNFDSKRKLVSSNIKKVTINGFEALSRIVKFTEEGVEQKSYYIYINNNVYILSTTSESLYDDLDQIANSFQYTP